jgi:hypothetical protein
MIISISKNKTLKNIEKKSRFKFPTDENFDVIDNQMMIMNNIDIYHIKKLDHVHVQISYEF